MAEYLDKYGNESFYPDDDDDTFWTCNRLSCSRLLEIIQEKWPDVSLDQIAISAEHLQTSCIGDDLYDRENYDNFIVVNRFRDPPLPPVRCLRKEEE